MIPLAIATAEAASVDERAAEVARSLAAVVPGVEEAEAAAVARLIVTNPRSPEVARRLTPLLAKAAQATAEQVADTIETPGNSLSIEVSGSRELRKWLSADAKAGNQGLGAGASVSAWRLQSGFSATTDPGSRSIGGTFNVGATVRKNSPVEVHHVQQVQFNYGTNRDYLMALVPMPGRETTLSLMNRILPGSQDLKPSPTPSDPARAALRAFRNTIAPNADRFNNVESITTGKGIEVVYKGSASPETAGAGYLQGAAKLSIVQMERLAPGQRPGEGTPFVTVSLGLSGKGGVVAGYSGGVDVALAHTTDPRGQTRDPNLATLAGLVRDRRPIGEAASGATSLFRDPALLREAMKLLLKPGGKADGADRVRVITDRAVGGVRVYYDPALLGASVPPAEVIDLLGEVVRRTRAGKTDFVLRRRGGAERFITLSLKRWLETESPTLGSLTRVRGYIVRGDDVVLIGQAEPGRSAVDADLLIVALNAIYRDGTEPFVSLDPALRDSVTRHVPRIGGVLERFHESEFVRVMLDADYDMKRISLGELRPSAPGFRSWYDLLQRSHTGGGMHRSWLSPVAAEAGDVLEHGPAVLFRSDVKVQSEGMRQIGGMLVPTQQTDPEDLEAAEQLTQHYAAIEGEIDSFYRLHGLFDVAKLCAILRHRGVRSPVLEAIAARSVRTVAPLQPDRQSLLDPYAEIGPKLVSGTNLRVAGGVELAARLPGHVFTRSEALGALVAGKKTFVPERMTPLSGAAIADLLVRSASRDVLEDRFSEAVARSTEALRRVPSHPMARFLRAFARHNLGRPREAVADLDAIVAREPLVLGLRGFVRLAAGDEAGAQRDVDAAVARYSHQPSLWLVSAWVRLCRRDFAGAEKALAQLARLDPGGDSAPRMRGLAATIRQMPPAKARREIRMAMRLPFGLTGAMVAGDAARREGDTAAARRHLARALRQAQRLAGHPAVREYHAREQILLLRALNETGERSAPSSDKRPEAAVADAERLIALHPRWASGYLLKAYASLWLGGAANDQRPATRDQRRGSTAHRSRPAVKPHVTRKPPTARETQTLLARAFPGRAVDDPLMEYWRRLLGAPRVARRNFIGLALMTSLMRNQNPDLWLGEIATQSPRLARAATVLRQTRALTLGPQGPRDLDAKQQEAWRRRLRAALPQALGSRPDPDLGSTLLWFICLGMHAHMERDAGRPEVATRLARTFLKLPSSSYSGEVAPRTIGPLRALMISEIVKDAEERCRRDAELQRLIGAVARGEEPLERLQERIAALAESLGPREEASDPPLLRALLAFHREMTPITLERWAVAQAQSGAGSGEGSDGEALAMRRVELDRAWLERWEGAEARLDAWLALAKTAVERRTIATMVPEGIRRVAGEVAPDPATVHRLQRIVARVTARCEAGR
jgi:hypothetical protein